MATKEEIRALVKAELQKRRPNLPERAKDSIAKNIANTVDGDPEAAVADVKNTFPVPEADATKEDSNR